MGALDNSYDETCNVGTETHQYCASRLSFAHAYAQLVRSLEVILCLKLRLFCYLKAVEFQMK